VALGCALFVWLARAQEDKGAPRRGAGPKKDKEKAKAEERPAIKASRTPLYYGTGACSNAGCHSAAPKDWPAPLLCRCEEFNIWEAKDKHADAYSALLPEKNELAKQMQRLLPGKKLHQRDDCLACHAVVIKDKALLERSKKTALFKIEQGVSCVVCHGPSREWVTKHGNVVEFGEWRGLGLTRAQKEQFGMNDLWDPIRRTELCASCHIGKVDGDPSQRKFVTHEMYAAGHPPLPPFEIATFSEEMPKHWQYLRDKKPLSVQKELGYVPGEQEQTKLILVGAAVSLRESMKLLAEQATEALKAEEGSDKRVLDFSNFDCYACHHDLKPQSWRQKRGFAGKPGRLPMRPWPTALIELAIRHESGGDAKALAAQRATYKKLEKAVNDAFDARPLGSPALIAKSATALGKWADALARELNRKPCDKKIGQALLVELVRQHKDAIPKDFDYARLVAWSFRTMNQELRPRDAAIGKIQLRLDEALKLNLPQGRKVKIADELDRTMKALNEFTPDSFNDAFRQFHKRLSKDGPS
jgi:hypothetical protein